MNEAELKTILIFWQFLPPFFKFGIITRRLEVGTQNYKTLFEKKKLLKKVAKINKEPIHKTKNQD